MIEFVIYDITIFVLLKIRFLKKISFFNNFRFYFMLSVVTLLTFIFNGITIMNSETFMGIDSRNPVLRKLFLMLFFGLKLSLYGFFISDMFRSESNKKAPEKGEKGIRGLRGEPGAKAEECDEAKCNLDICNHKILDYVSEIYSDILIKKGKKGSKHYQISNNFLKNKIKKLCQSPQMEKYREKKSSKEVYNYIKETWKKWINIILQYQKGEYFFETDFLTDNDFDNLIQDEDKIYYPNFDNNGIGTPSKGVESPFDEIKKFDMWYWGEPSAALVKIVHKCDLDEQSPTLKFINSNDYIHMWRSSTALQTKINNNFIPYQQKGDSNISIYRPKIIENEEGLFKPLGDIVLSGDINEHFKKSIDEIIPKENMDPNYEINKPGDPSQQTQLVGGDIKSPLDFKEVYKSQRKNGVGKGVNGYSFWRPVPPRDYVCLANMMDNNYFIYKPDTSQFACVPQKCVRPKAKHKNTKIWKNEDLGDDDFVSGDLNGIYSNYNNYLYYGSDEEDLEIIPEGEEGSCVNNMDQKVNNSSKWIVNEKNSEKYSIHSFFEKDE
jgi:hypothetical protein